jgi:hypothetical protein
MIEAEQIMKRCQAGTRNYEEANNLHAACYGMIGKLLAQRTWVDLTQQELDELDEQSPSLHDFVQNLMSKLKDKNT